MTAMTTLKKSVVTILPAMTLILNEGAHLVINMLRDVPGLPIVAATRMITMAGIRVEAADTGEVSLLF